MKPKLLIDKIADKEYILYNDNKILSIGRGKDCDIPTIVKDHSISNNSYLEQTLMGVSRYHACIVHEKNGLAYLWDTNSKFGTMIIRENTRIPVYNKTQLFINDKIILARIYELELKEIDIVSEQNLENKRRLSDTQTGSSLDIIITHH